MSAKLEGTLNKWTNYYSGWQPRWFILEGGILSYYLSSNDVQQGSKGSVKVTSCDIIVHHKDNRRIDLVINGGRHMYLRANSQSEKQKWLVALGSTKQQELTLEASSPTEQNRGDIVKSRMIDLHLSCQLLVTHIASLKTALNDTSTLSNTTLNELSMTLSSTCDEFLNALAECMDLCYDDEQWPDHIKPLLSKPLSASSPMSRTSKQLGHSGFPITRTSSNGFSEDELYTTSFPLTSSVPSTPVRLTTPTHDLSLPLHLRQHVLKTAASHQYNQPVEDKDRPDDTSFQPTRNQDHDKELTVFKDVHPQSSETVLSDPPQQHSRSNSDLFLTPTSSPVPSPSPSPTDEGPKPLQKHETFFSKVPHQFKNIDFVDNDGIPTAEFLQCCREVIPFFDALSPTAFAPVKSDINGNIEKLSSKYHSNPDQYQTLQAIVLHEFNTKTHTVKNSSTDALLWLKRAMEFIYVFLSEVAHGEQSLDVAASTAYTKSLKRYHNWLVRGIFNFAVKAVPYYHDFLKLLGSNGTPESNVIVLDDMKVFSKALGSIIDILNQFYQKHQLDLPSHK